MDRPSLAPRYWHLGWQSGWQSGGGLDDKDTRMNRLLSFVSFLTLSSTALNLRLYLRCYLRRFLTAGLSMALLLGSGLVWANPKPPQRIAYTSDRPFDRDLLLIDLEDPDHPEIVRRGAPQFLDSDPTFSADDRWIVYAAEGGGNQDLYLLPATAASAFAEATAVRLTFAPSFEGAPAVSPDGEWLAYTSSRSGRSDIWIQPLDPQNPQAAATQARNLTPGPGSDFRPAFSPDGHWLAFSSSRGGSARHLSLYVLELASGTIFPAPHSDQLDGSPRFTADGKALVFQRAEATGQVTDSARDRRLWQIPFDGSDLTGPRFGAAEIFSREDREELVPTPLPDGGLARLMASDRTWKADLGHKLPPEATDLNFYSLAVDSTGRRFVASINARDQEAFNPFAQEIPTRSPILTDFGAPISLPDRDLSALPTHLLFPSFDGLGRVAGGDLGGNLVRAAWEGPVVERIEPQMGTAAKALGPLGIAGHSADPLSNRILAQVGPPFAPPGAPTDIWLFEADGQGHNLTADTPGNHGLPRFSTDGRRIVFRSGRDGNHEIYAMDPDAGQVVRLTDHPATDTAPALSPDGRCLAFTSTRDGNHELYLLELTATGQPLGHSQEQPRRLTSHPGIDMHPFFSPDGAWLVFASDRSGEPDEILRTQMRFSPQPAGELWVMRLADGLLVRLTHNGWEDGLPSWGPGSPLQVP